MEAWARTEYDTRNLIDLFAQLGAPLPTTRPALEQVRVNALLYLGYMSLN
jgi:hypothetical protein